MSNARFSIVQSRAVRDTRITSPQFRTLSALGMYADEDGWCYPKLATLAKDLGKSKQAISKDIQALCEYGYVEIKHQFREDGSQKSNLYRLVFDGRGQPQVEGGSTPEVEGGSTPEVDALTPHVNAPSKRPIGSKGRRPPKPPKTVDEINWVDTDKYKSNLGLPEIQVYIATTGRYPGMPQMPIIYESIQKHKFTTEYLLPFWRAWVGKGYNVRNLAWLTEWAVSGEVPKNFTSNASGKKINQPESGGKYDALFAEMDNKYGG